MLEKKSIIYTDMYSITHLPFKQEGILCKQKLIRTPTEIRYIERPVFLKKVHNENLRVFELRSQENINVPIWKL